MEHAFLIANWANYLLQALFVALVLAASRRWGAPAARLAALVNVAAGTVTSGFGLLPLPETVAVWVVCALDLMTAAAFLYVAGRYNSLWITAAVLAQGVQAGIDVIYIGQGSGFDRIHHFLFGAVENIFTYAIQAAILGAVLADRRRLAHEGAVRV